jgi:PPOX class probable F420-dependent enzyme
MGSLTTELQEFLDGHSVGVLATIARDGTARQSLVYFARDGERLLVSTLTDRVKARDVRRRGWASLCVMGHQPPYPSATFSGPAEIRTEGIGPATAAVAQKIAAAPEPPEPMSDQTLAEAGRVILTIAIEHVGATTYIKPATASEVTT